MKSSNNVPRNRIQIIQKTDKKHEKVFLNSMNVSLKIVKNIWNTVSRILWAYESISEEYDWEE